MAKTLPWPSQDGPEMARNDMQQDRDMVLCEKESEDQEEQSSRKRSIVDSMATLRSFWIVS